MVRPMSPVRISGVTPAQQAPPGWLTSAKPSMGWIPSAELTMTVLPDEFRRRICTDTVSLSSKPLGETKSREGKAMMLIGNFGGSLTGKLLRSTRWSAVNGPATFDRSDALPTSSKARTWKLYEPGGRLLSMNVVGAGADPSGFETVKMASPLR